MPQNPHILLAFDKVHHLPCAPHAKRHLNVQKWPRPGVFCTFWLRNVLHRHNCVHFFDISTCQKCSENGVFCTCQLRNVLRATTACTFSTSQLPKRPGVFCTFWLRNVLCATTACTFSTSQLPKVGPDLVCFAHSNFEMCFAPQRCALFRHLNFQKWSEPLVFCTFWLLNVLRATTACTFSTSQLPKWSGPGVFCTF